MRTTSILTLSAAAIALSFGVAGPGAVAPAQAGPMSCSDTSMAMADDGMKKDTMAMTDDGMAKDGAMADDGMAKDGAMAMADDGMAKDGAMSGDTMAKDGAMAMADDGMAKDDAMGDDAMKDGMMMADYTVKPGDSLWSIAAATLCDGDKYPEIVAANADMLGGGMMIHPGDVLHIPGD